MKSLGYIAIFVFSVVLSMAAILLLLRFFPGMPLSHGDDSSVFIDQSQVCVANTDEKVLNCPEGGMFMARLSFDNEQVSAFSIEQRLLNTMALYCDTNYPVHKTQAGILCVLTHARITSSSSAAEK